MKRLILWLVIGTVFMSCGRPPLPTRQPVSASSGNNDPEITIELSTNCVAVGETLTITLRMTNDHAEPVQIDPSSDLILEKRTPTQVRVDRWSASADYPQSFDPVLPAGTSRDYTWQWVAREDFAQRDVLHAGTKIFYATNQDDRVALVYLGVGWYTDGEYTMQCHEMR